MARNTDKKIDAVLDRVWLGVNTRSKEDEEKNCTKKIFLTKIIMMV